MDKKINLHKKFVQAEIMRISKMDQPMREHKSRELAFYNDEMTRNFQHERQIHLYVTLFFALLVIGSWFMTSFLLLQFNGEFAASCGSIVTSVILSLILTVLEGFYVAYYYRLENRIAKLYPLPRNIYRLQSPQAKHKLNSR